MARRGSLVGDAYVRIHADSSSIDRELRRDFNKRAKAAGTESGRENSDAFWKSWERTSKQRTKGIDQQLVRATVGGQRDWDRAFNASGMASVDKFAKKAKARLKDISGATTGDISPKNLEKLNDALRDIDKWAQRASAAKALKEQIALGEKLAKETEARIAKERKAQLALGNAIVRDMKKRDRAIAALQKAFNDETTKKIREQEKAFKSYAANIEAGAHGVESAFLQMFGKERQKQIDGLNRALIKGVIGGKSEWEKQFAAGGDESIDKFVKRTKARLRTVFVEEGGIPLNDLRTAFRDLDNLARNSATGLSRFSRFINRSRVNTDRFATVVGKVFGKDSRNNFFNFVGTVVEGAAKMTTSLLKLPLKASALAFDTLTVAAKGFKTVGEGIFGLLSGKGLSGFAKNLPELGDMIKDLAVDIGVSLAGALKAGIPALIGLAAAMQLAALAIPALLALIGSLVAIIGSLAGAIAVGLAGALLTLTPVLLAVGGGVGVLIGFFTQLNNLTDAQKKKLGPFLGAWNRFKKLFQGKFFDKFTTALNDFAPIFKLLTPLVEGFANAVTLIATNFDAVFTGGKIKKAFGAFTKVLPDILVKVGNAFTNLFGGFLIALQPVLPFAVRLADAFAGMADKFFEWTSSVEGQTAIHDFLKNAFDVAKTLWDTIVGVGEALGTLLASGSENGGQTILDKILEKVQQFVAFLNSPDGQQAMKEFFEGGVTLAQDLWNGISSIVTALRAIDWEDARSKAETVINFISGLITAIIIAINVWNATVANVGEAFRNVANTLIGVYNTIIGPVIDKLLGGFSAVVNLIADMLEALSNVPGFGWAKDAADKLHAAAKKADELGDSLREIPKFIPVVVTVTTNFPAVQKSLRGKLARDVIFGASGGILTGPTFVRPNVVGGEAGDEALVPLKRPLALVDPSVRALSAFAQGLPITKGASGGVLGSGVTIAPGAIQVTVPNSNPILVAEAVLDRLAVGVRV